MASLSPEHAEHAEHAAEHGNKKAALLIAVLAALLAVTEQQAKRAEITVETNAVLAADTWNQYQAKSVRSAMAQDLERVAGTFDAPANAELVAKREQVLKQLRSDREHYDNDPKSGKEALAEHAHEYEEVRDHQLERAHAFDYGAAALELGIVLSTASVITNAKMLLRFAFLMGAIGVGFAIGGAVAPEMVAF